MDSGARNVWTTNATSVLIDCWEDRLDDLRGQKRNTGVYADITEALHKLGIERTVAEVRYKIKNLSQMYRDGVKGLTTGSGPSDWPHFERVRELIVAQSSNDPTVMQESQCTVDEHHPRTTPKTWEHQVVRELLKGAPKLKEVAPKMGQLRTNQLLTSSVLPGRGRGRRVSATTGRRS
ncbi:hypothetical protein HPB48_021327 [Haemaphysalis longicornis]|uniref:Myb/SANT-like DNA-binding domain-containing protein n=1 Tax=Haemaphysalis longicornis TaxID=44386 RepID=A0A9J6FTA6_HAELO|nr:hypothetical protein HPB48_021327 [Haemaphysalis longicornis]